MIGLRAQAEGLVHRTGLPTRLGLLLLALLSLVMALLGFVAFVGDEDGNETPMPPDLDVTTIWIVGGLGMLARIHRVQRARRTITTERPSSSTPAASGGSRGARVDATALEYQSGWALLTGHGPVQTASRTSGPGPHGRAYRW